MSDIKILVATHKEFYRPENPLIFQVQVGSALADHHIEGILHDDEGENISKKNRSYCELTAQEKTRKHLLCISPMEILWYTHVLILPA